MAAAEAAVGGGGGECSRVSSLLVRAGVLVQMGVGFVCDDEVSVCFVCRSGRRRRREGRAVRGAVEGLRGAGLQRAAARGEGLLLPAGAYRAGEATKALELGIFPLFECWDAVPPRFWKGFLWRVCVHALESSPNFAEVLHDRSELWGF